MVLGALRAQYHWASLFAANGVQLQFSAAFLFLWLGRVWGPHVMLRRQAVMPMDSSWQSQHPDHEPIVYLMAVGGDTATLDTPIDFAGNARV
jgi:hypothetical protein